jgi:hypothetical protein
LCSASRIATEFQVHRLSRKIRSSSLFGGILVFIKEQAIGSREFCHAINTYLLNAYYVTGTAHWEQDRGLDLVKGEIITVNSYSCLLLSLFSFSFLHRENHSEPLSRQFSWKASDVS